MPDQISASPACRLILLTDIKNVGDIQNVIGFRVHPVSQEDVITDLRENLKMLSREEADALGSNLIRFLAIEADKRGLVRPGGVKGKPNSPLPSEKPLSPRAITAMLGIQAVAENLRGQNTAWLMFENKVLIAHHQVIMGQREAAVNERMSMLAELGF